MPQSNVTSLPHPPANAASVVARLEEAGQTLLALPHSGPTTRLVQSGMEWVRDAAYVATEVRGKLRPPIPDAAQISRMDQALAWIGLISSDRFVLRRIVGARSLIDPLNGRHLYSWRRVALSIGADHKAVQRWHAQGIDIIVAALRQPQRPATIARSVPSSRYAAAVRS